MALLAHQPQASQWLSRPQYKTEPVKLRASVSFCSARRTCKLASSKRISQWSCQPILLRKNKCFKVLSFKGSQNVPEATDSKYRSSVQLSLSQQESGESPDSIKNSLSVTSDDGENNISGSHAIKNLFKMWASLLQSQAVKQATDEVKAGSVHSELTNTGPETYGEQTRKLLKAALLRFWVLDAMIKLPLLIFPPFYLAVRLAYGMEVARELTPLWTFGPLICAFYILLIRGICYVYIFLFKYGRNLIINLPTYYRIIRERKLLLYPFQFLIDLKNMEYKRLALRKLEQLSEWAKEKRLDLIEAIWPYYCRTIRFLKRAHLL